MHNVFEFVKHVILRKQVLVRETREMKLTFIVDKVLEGMWIML